MNQSFIDQGIIINKKDFLISHTIRKAIQCAIEMQTELD